MFRKKLTKGSGGASGAHDIRPFDENFWSWYVDSYSRGPELGGNVFGPTSGNTSAVSETIAPNSKKYHHNLTAVATVRRYFESLKLEIPSTNQIVALLKSPYTQGDAAKTFQLIRMFQLSSEGLFITNENRDKCGHPIRYVGAENWENVMCYLDALLFAMFANLESFEPILFISNTTRRDQYLVNQLSGLLRVYVNMLRSGNLITTDLTMRLCEVLMKLGFTEAMSHKQQDCASLFEFLTEVLSMPLLTFKIDIKHEGKFSKEDDEKYSRERLLFVSIPNEEEREILRARDGTTTDDEAAPLLTDDSDPILLEECLEHYFNNSISVKRELERRATLETLKFPTLDEGVMSHPIPEDARSVALTGDAAEMVPSPSSSSRLLSLSRVPTARIAPRTRSSTLSIWSLNELESDQHSASTLTQSRPRRNSALTGKEVSLPAWMFLRLLPFYTDDNEINNLNGKNHSIAKNSREFVNRRPILPICLKRYSYSDSTATKEKRRIIIPPIINLPNFVADDEENDNPGGGSYKLILESAVCHRGTSISLGHFVLVIRKDTNNLQETDEEALNATWYLYDDMKKKARVVEKSFTEIFDTEWPYMLFYRLVSNEECEGESNNSSMHSVNGCDNSLVLPPGFNKTKYWGKDESLQPILSADELAEGESKCTSASTASSLPISEVSPLDSKFVDIRNKYFWYVVDGDKNYFKELSIPSRHGTREPSITISPQFRRNSQWSDVSNMSVTRLDDSVVENPTPKVVLVGKATAASAAAVTSAAAAGVSKKWGFREKERDRERDKEPNKSPQQKAEFTSDALPAMTLEAREDEDDRPHLFHKRNKRKTEEYRREKCTIQ